MIEFHRDSSKDIFRDSNQYFFQLRVWHTDTHFLNQRDSLNRFDINYRAILDNGHVIYKPFQFGLNGGRYGGLSGATGHAISDMLCNELPFAIEYRSEIGEQMALLTNLLTLVPTHRNFRIFEPSSNRQNVVSFKRKFCYRINSNQLSSDFGCHSDLPIGRNENSTLLRRSLIYPASDAVCLEYKSGFMADPGEERIHRRGRALYRPPIDTFGWTLCCSILEGVTTSEYNLLLRGGPGPQDPPPSCDPDLLRVVAVLESLIDDSKDSEVVYEAVLMLHIIKKARFKNPDLTLSSLDTELSIVHLQSLSFLLTENFEDGDPNDYLENKAILDSFLRLITQWECVHLFGNIFIL